MTLSGFIEANVERLLVEWQTFAETLPPLESVEVSTLRNGAEDMILAIARDLDRSGTNEHRLERSRGNRSQSSSELTETAQKHAADSLAAGFTLDLLVAEYRALRASVVRTWLSSVEGGDRQTLHELARFNEAMDQSLTEAIRWFNGRLERSRDIFVGILGHDLRNPLSAIMAAAEVSLMASDPEAVRDSVSRISRSAKAMREMIDLLLDFSQTRLGEHIPISPKETALASVCEDVAQGFELSHRENRIVVRCSSRVTGKWDGDRLRQALSNLVGNALEHGKRGGTVTLSCKRKSNEVLLSVHNEGRPIPLARQRDLFEPFRRPEADDDDAASHGSGGHVGLGLYVVNQIAIAHGGRVEVSSRAGEGTTVTMRLPLTRAGRT